MPGPGRTVILGDRCRMDLVRSSIWVDSHPGSARPVVATSVDIAERSRTRCAVGTRALPLRAHTHGPSMVC